MTAITAQLRRTEWFRSRPDWSDLVAIAAIYIATVATFRFAFAVVGEENGISLFLVFGVAGLLLCGVTAPALYMTLVRGRPIAELGVGTHHLRASILLGIAFGIVQSTSLWGYDFPASVDWVPLLVMSLAVGLFEAILFRGFIQNRLEASFGLLPSIVGAAALYSLYHVGYEMAGSELLFLLTLGVVYATIFRLTRNILIIWPLVTPIGAFYNRLDSGEMEGLLPWLSIFGFFEVLAAMAAVLFFAERWRRRRGHSATPIAASSRRVA
jgi:hypothetical protein